MTSLFYPAEQILKAMTINRLRAMGMLIDLPVSEHQKIASCSICLNRGYIIRCNEELKPCICHILQTHQS